MEVQAGEQPERMKCSLVLRGQVVADRGPCWDWRCNSGQLCSIMFGEDQADQDQDRTMSGKHSGKQTNMSCTT